MCPKYTDDPAHMAVSFGPTPSMIQFPNAGLCMNYFFCDHYTRFVTF